MLNPQAIGSYISKLRKEKDLTQVELSDKLNVSHQAVSKWERGESLPDIGTLLEISKLFNTSVDLILNGGNPNSGLRNVGKIVEKIAANQPEDAAQVINSGDADAEGFVSIAPIVKTSIMEKITRQVDGAAFTIEHIVNLAPFLDKDSLQSIFEKADIPPVSWEHILSLAPFIDENSITKMIQTSELKPTLREIVSIAPFSGERLNEIVENADLSQVSWEYFMALAPFISEDVLFLLFTKINEESLSLNQILQAAPFLGGKIDQLLETANVSDIQFIEILSIAPFVNKDTLAALLDKADTAELKLEELLGLAPFIKKETLAALIEKNNFQELSPNAISQIAPFLAKETLVSLISRISANKL